MSALPARDSFSVLETTVYSAAAADDDDDDEGVRLLPEHLLRMRASAAQLSAAYGAPCFDCSGVALEAVRALIAAQLGDPRQRHRVRLLLDCAGRLTVQATPEPTAPEPAAAPPVALVLDTQPTDTDSLFVRCKTTFRPMYDAAAKRLPPSCPPGTHVLLYNASGRVTEANIANVAVSLPDADGRLALFTPPLADGLLPGTMRQRLLDAGHIREGPVTVDQFRRAVANGWPVMCMNSVRGLYTVTPAVPDCL
ncbi:hypothetical protein LPJ61_003233 [Coemansia biformis]|uniref:D-aminoacid aminotransferase-like PLP-dependent enzyme n=1 Tax=Coemansia biformis TaxID=1286918 RepID=A0A9W7YCY5_9FUNG|nr:hypothetical protein LPJ61_003233 [Coemansia biformis]